MTYIGFNHFTGKQVMESNIFNFNENIYSKKISVFFIKKLRKEKKFSKLDDLKKQLLIDKKQTKLYFKKHRFVPEELDEYQE